MKNASFVKSGIEKCQLATVVETAGCGCPTVAGDNHREEPLSRVTNGSVSRVWQQLKREKSLMAKQSGGRE